MTAVPANYRCILLDIEGTTSSVSFVFDVMFPYVRRELAAYLEKQWNSPQLQETCELIAKDAGESSFAKWCEKNQAIDESARQALVRGEIIRLMDADVKATGLKQLQGMIWENGFHSRELLAHVYDDVPPALVRWNAAGKDVRIYSSGSIQAQKLFFGHTTVGNLLPHFRGHYDTTIGSKREALSYSRIAEAIGISPNETLFVSDIVAELAAARIAGFQTALAIRPGNAVQPTEHGHREIRSFAEVA